MQIRQLSFLSSTNSMIHVLFVWSLQCAFYAAAIMRVQWRCEKQASVLFGITTKISPSTFIGFVIRAAKVKVSALILAFEWYRKGLIRKALSGRVFSGSWIWPKYGVGFGKTQDILTGNGILQLPGKRDSPQDARYFCLYIGNSRNHIFWGQTRVNPALNCWLLSN